jgi:hypothetical protein
MSAGKLKQNGCEVIGGGASGGNYWGGGGGSDPDVDHIIDFLKKFSTLDRDTQKTFIDIIEMMEQTAAVTSIQHLDAPARLRSF